MQGLNIDDEPDGLEAGDEELLDNEDLETADADLAYIAGAFGEDALDEVITAICEGMDPEAAIRGFTAEMDEIDEFFEEIPAAAPRASASPVWERCAA